MICTVTLRDFKGRTGTMKVANCRSSLTMANAKSFAEFVAEHSDAQVVGYGIHESHDGDSADNGKYDRVLQGLKMLYIQEFGNKPTGITLLAPRDEDVDEDQEAVSDFAEDMKDALVALTGQSYTFNGSGIVSRTPGSMERKRVLTGV